MKRAKHSLSHYKLLTCKMGQLVPVTWFEALPGDTIQQATSALIRCAPLVTPVMHPVHVRFHHWFVPNRLIWSSWQDYITGGADGLNASSPPYLNDSAVGVNVGSIHDYMGVPTGASITGHVSALPLRAYALIFNEFYRDEDLVSAVGFSTADGADSTTYGANDHTAAPLNIAWEKDYLTSARPWVVKGASVTLPLGSTAPVKGIGYTGNITDTAGATFRETDGTSPTYAHAVLTSQTGQIGIKSDTGTAASAKPQVFADLSSATSVDINTVRHAFALQRFEEARARYGSRYTEYLRYLGVRSSDARLQRPEYLGGGRNVIQFSEVLQTGVTTSGSQTGVGTMFGHGITGMRTNRYRRFFEEHGIVMTLMSVRPKTMYANALERRFMRGLNWSAMAQSKEDYWQRELQTIGQQKVAGVEADNSAGDTVFGYQDRYDEYRRMESSIAGLFRTTLNTWHLARSFGSTPSLNSTFVQCVPSTRVFADTSNDNLYVCANHQIQARRLVAREGRSMTF